jgi:serine/threonine protein kinase
MNYGRYQIIKELGKGSMGVVYQAHDPNLDVMLALKVLRQDRVVSEAFVRRFLAEAKALGRLDHSNIVRVYNVDEDGGTVYIAMEFIEGEPLNEVMQKRQFNPDEIIRIGIDVAETLSYAHQKGIIHRDIKPSNILLKSDGRLKITDFGIAHIEDSSGPQQTQAGEILGTPAYMSPEQVMSRPVDGRSDLFSLGIILYELSTGKRPFVGENLPAIFNAITRVNPIEPLKLNPKISRDLAQIIMKCLMKNPDERFQTGKDLAEALHKCFGAKGPVGAPVSLSKSKSKLIVIISLSIFLSAGIIGGVSYYFAKPKSEDRTPSVKGLAVKENVRSTALKVESTPLGAQVFVDGTLKGATPIKLPLPAGKYEVKLTLTDYYDWEAQVQVQEGGETPLLIHLVPMNEKKM